jgi:hypothetical protein
LAVFAAAQVGLALVMEYWQPGLRDREYGVKLALLRERLAQRPGRPLVLAIGSSRVALGLCPEAMAPAADEPVVFNFGILGAGTPMEQVVLKRVLRHGIRPDFVLLEVWPALMSHVRGSTDADRFGVNRFGFGDTCLMRRYAADPTDYVLRWCQDWLVPWYSNRELLARLLLTWQKTEEWSQLDGAGWRVWRGPRNPGTAGEIYAQLRDRHKVFLAKCHLHPDADQALRESIALCRRLGIQVGILFMPESRELQSFYPETLRAEVDDYLRTLSRECRVPILDCRNLGPEGAFPDSIHLSSEGARAFSARFSQEMLPRLAGP